MNKKYLILKRPIPKAQWGMDFAQKNKERRDNLFLQTYGENAFINTPESQINTAGTQLDMANQGKAAGMVGAGANLAEMGSNMLFNNAFEKNSQTDGFGMEKIDDKDVKLMTGQSAASGALKGAGTGASIGSIIPGVGTAIGAGVGAVVGGIAGLFGGKKKAEKAKEQYEETLRKNMKTAGRASDLAAAKSLYAKNGTKTKGVSLVPKKKVLTK